MMLEVCDVCEGAFSGIEPLIGRCKKCEVTICGAAICSAWVDKYGNLCMGCYEELNPATDLTEMERKVWEAEQ